MWEFWWVFVVLGAVLGLLGVVLWPRWQRHRHQSFLAKARQSFHCRREWLEAKFMTLASRSGKPRGRRWVDCEFDDQVAFARDRSTGHLRALVGVSIQFEACDGGGSENVELVASRNVATVVFRLDGPEWEVDGRAYFNLNPAEIIARYPHELETVD